MMIFIFLFFSILTKRKEVTFGTLFFNNNESSLKTSTDKYFFKKKGSRI